MKHLVLIRGGGELGTAIAHRLHRAGYGVLILEKERPSALRRAIAFSDAVYDGEKTVERVTCYCAESLKAALSLLEKGKVTMLVDATGRYVRKFPPHVLVNTLDGEEDEAQRVLPADFRIGIGQGYCARQDVDCVIEAVRSHYLGRIIYNGRATKWAPPEESTPPGCLISAEYSGVFQSSMTISHILRAGDTVGEIYDDRGQTTALLAMTGGVLRGLLHDRYRVSPGMRLAEIDPEAEPSICYVISDKARCISGSVLEAVMAFEHRLEP